jgi:hypothetical protein
LHKLNYFETLSTSTTIKIVKVKKLSQGRRIKATSGFTKQKTISSLTKKQKQKLKLAKARKIIIPTSTTFSKYIKVLRSVKIKPFMLLAKVLVHDGYS